jgi:hypothetical protein
MSMDRRDSLPERSPIHKKLRFKRNAIQKKRQLFLRQIRTKVDGAMTSGVTTTETSIVLDRNDGNTSLCE